MVYGSCHCILSHNYGGATTWPVPNNFDNVEGLRYIGAYDATTGRMIGSFQPQMETRAVRGPWAMTVDTNGVLWAGGDTTRTKVASTTWQTSGGFSRFPRVDTVAPATPASPSVTDNGDGTGTPLSADVVVPIRVLNLNRPPFVAAISLARTLNA